MQENRKLKFSNLNPPQAEPPSLMLAIDHYLNQEDAEEIWYEKILKGLNDFSSLDSPVREKIYELNTRDLRGEALSDKELVVLGMAHVFGKTLPLNYKRARECYEKASAQCAPALNHLGVIYLSGFGVDKKPELAFLYFSQAAALGFTEANFNLGSFYLNERAGALEPKKALHFLTLAAQKGHLGAYFNLGQLYLNGHGVKKDIKTGLAYFRDAADKGHVKSCEALANLCFSGIDGSLPPDFELARVYYLKAADSNSATAFNRLGNLYEFGKGVDKDINQAMTYYRRGAELGSATAFNNLGTIFALGKAVPKDLDEAADCYRQAAALGDSQALANLSWLFGRTATAQAAFCDRLLLSKEEKSELCEKAQARLQNNCLPGVLEDPIALYHTASALQNIAVLDKLRADHPEIFEESFLNDLFPREDHHYAGTVISLKTLRGKQIAQEMEGNLTRQARAYALHLIKQPRHEKEAVFLQRVNACLGLLAMQDQDVEQGCRFFFKLNPRHLAPRENFEVGYFIYQHGQHNDYRDANSLATLETMRQELFSARERPPLEKVSAQTLELAYSHLQAAATAGNHKAQYLLVRHIFKNDKPLIAAQNNKADNLINRILAHPGLRFPPNFNSFKEATLQLAAQILVEDPKTTAKTAQQNSENVPQQPRFFQGSASSSSAAGATAAELKEITEILYDLTESYRPLERFIISTIGRILNREEQLKLQFLNPVNEIISGIDYVRKDRRALEKLSQSLNRGLNSKELLTLTAADQRSIESIYKEMRDRIESFIRPKPSVNKFS